MYVGNDSRFMHSLNSAGHVTSDGSDATLADQLLVSALNVKAFVELQKTDKTLEGTFWWKREKDKNDNQILSTTSWIHA